MKWHAAGCLVGIPVAIPLDGWILFPTSICHWLQVWMHCSIPTNQVCLELGPYRMLVICTLSW
jgi:hypothetical protein